MSKAKRRSRDDRDGVTHRHPVDANAPQQPDPTDQHVTGLLSVLEWLARGWRTLVIIALGTAFTTLLSSLLTLTPQNQLRVFLIAHDHPLLITSVLVTLLAVSLGAIMVLWGTVLRKAADEVMARFGHWYGPLLVSSLSLTALSTFSVGALIATVVVRPDWCPTLLCQAVHADHDTSLEIGITAVQSPYSVIPGNPGEYSLSRPPPTTGLASVSAMPLPDVTDSNTGEAYRLIIRVRNLRPVGEPLLIEHVGLLVVSAAPLDGTVNVWKHGAVVTYAHNLVKVVYGRQQRGARVATPAIGLLGAPAIQLLPGESDDLTLEVTAPDETVLSYRPVVDYQTPDDGRHGAVLLGETQRVAFIGNLKWHSYVLQKGLFVGG